VSESQRLLQDVDELVDAICSLAAANRLTGLWDHVRFNECKKDDLHIDAKLVVLSERRSRYNVEQRAVQRTRIDRSFKSLIRQH
jgi:hypothetical protein